MNVNAKTAPRGSLKYKIIKAPGPGLIWKLKNSLAFGYVRGWLAYHIAPLLGKIFGFGTIVSRLLVKVHKANGEWINYGVVSYRVVTTAFVNALAAALHTQSSAGDLFYHALGTDNDPGPAITDTGMNAELTTEYNPDGVRPAGTHTATNNVYESVATITIDSGTPAIVEHGVMSAATGAATLIDRHTFAVVNLGAGDSFMATYQITFTAGG